MLKGIPAVLSPEMLEALAEMGHGDMIVIGDAYFAAKTMAKTNNNRLVRADGINAFRLVDAILELMPLDNWGGDPVIAMGFPDKESGEIVGTETTAKFAEIIAKHDKEAAGKMRYVDRFAFYDLSKTAFCTVATGDGKTNGCIILTKGVF